MADENRIEMAVPSSEREAIELGVVQEVVVPLAAAGVLGAANGAANAYVSDRLRGSGEPAASEPPSIELPPGVDRD